MTPRHKILVVDDEQSIHKAIRRVFRDGEFDIQSALCAGDGCRAFAAQRPDVAIIDVNLPDQSGLELFLDLRRIDARVPVIFITGHATNETAIEAMRRGAFDYLFKPLDIEELTDLVERAVSLSLCQREKVSLEHETKAGHAQRIVGKSPQMLEVYKAIGRVADQDVTVLITGESGVGKELAARAIYQHSGRSDQPFMAINCAAIPEPLLESEIFGHEKGAFTGADDRRIGKFEQCSGGTLLLDEVGDMSPGIQAKVLRIIETKQFQRVGGNELIDTDVRIIAATNRPLEQLVQEGSFRRDLFYRLNVFVIELPPLRQRNGDIPELVAYFLQRLNRELNKSITSVEPEAMEQLLHHSWPGNVRELQSVLRQWMLMTTGSTLSVREHPNLVSGSAHAQMEFPFDTSEIEQYIRARMESGSDRLYADYIATAERKLFESVLKYTAGNLSQASRLLGINRRTLRTRLKALGIRSP